MAKQAKQPKWIDWDGRFCLKSCKMVEEYIRSKTDLDQTQVTVHKTDTYLVVNYVVSNQLYSVKIALPGGVLYCLEEKDFDSLINTIKSRLVMNL